MALTMINGPSLNLFSLQKGVRNFLFFFRKLTLAVITVFKINDTKVNETDLKGHLFTKQGHLPAERESKNSK